MRDLKENQMSSNHQPLENIKSLMTKSVQQVEKFNQSYIKDAINEYYNLDKNFEDFKQIKEHATRMMGIINITLETQLKDKNEELIRLRKEILFLKNNQETNLIDVSLNNQLRWSPYRGQSSGTTLLLGKSPYPREEPAKEDNHSKYGEDSFSKPSTYIDSAFIDSMTKKRRAESEIKLRDQMSTNHKFP